MTFDAPIEILETTVKPEWIDYNGHLNMAYYLVIFDQAVDGFLELIGLGKSYFEVEMGSAFSLECRLTFQRELLEGDGVRVTVQLLDFSDKQFYFFMRMFHSRSGVLAATFEQVGIHVDMKTRKSTPFPPGTRSMLQEITTGHEKLPRPDETVRTMGIRRKA